MNRQEIIVRLSADEDRCKYCNSSTVSGGDIYCSASHSHDMDCDGNDFNLDYKIEEAISALEKQIPKKVIVDKRSKEELNGKCREFPKCPVCKIAVMGYIDDGFNIPAQAFCWDCGQALDWSDEK